MSPVGCTCKHYPHLAECMVHPHSEYSRMAVVIRDAKRRGFVLAIENAEAVRIYQERGEWPEELA